MHLSLVKLLKMPKFTFAASRTFSKIRSQACAPKRSKIKNQSFIVK